MTRPDADCPRTAEICICTFRRPALLEKLLNELQVQEAPPGWSLAILVVDNDPNGSAKAIVERYGDAPVPARYVFEGAGNIAIGRNRVLDEARGDYLLLIDDDEYPDRDWPLHLIAEAARSGSSAVLGPVGPVFADRPISGELSALYLRPRHPTSTPATASDWRTGNALLDRSFLDRTGLRFEPAFGYSGGEDFVFFARLDQLGGSISWCDEAVVHEIVPAERMNRQYLFRRALDNGRNYLRALLFLGQRKAAAKTLLAAAAYLALLGIPLLVAHLFAPRLWLRPRLRAAGQLGKWLMLLGSSRSRYQS